MRRLMTGAWNEQSNGVEFLHPVFRRISIALAIAGLLCLSVAFGHEPVVKTNLGKGINHATTTLLSGHCLWSDHCSRSREQR